MSDSKTQFGKVIAIAAPGLLIVHFIGHALALFPTLVLILNALNFINKIFSFLTILLAIVYVYPFSLMFVWAIIANLIPKPALGKIETPSQALKNIFLVGVNQFSRVTASRQFLSYFPYPSHFFYKLSGSQINPKSFISSPDCIPDPHLVEIGENSIIGHGAVLSGHLQSDIKTTYLGKIKIGKNVLIGAHCLVYPNVVIGDNSVLYAASMVRPGTVIPENEIWGGVPAKKIKNISYSGENPVLELKMKI